MLCFAALQLFPLKRGCPFSWAAKAFLHTWANKLIPLLFWSWVARTAHPSQKRTHHCAREKHYASPALPQIPRPIPRLTFWWTKFITIHGQRRETNSISAIMRPGLCYWAESQRKYNLSKTIRIFSFTASFLCSVVESSGHPPFPHPAQRNRCLCPQITISLLWYKCSLH